MSVYTAYVRCPRCGTPQHTWIRAGKFLPHNTTLCEPIQAKARLEKIIENEKLHS